MGVRRFPSLSSWERTASCFPLPFLLVGERRLGEAGEESKAEEGETLLCLLQCLGWLLLGSRDPEEERLRLRAEPLLLLSLGGEGEVNGEAEWPLSCSSTFATGW